MIKKKTKNPSTSIGNWNYKYKGNHPKNNFY